VRKNRGQRLVQGFRVYLLLLKKLIEHPKNPMMFDSLGVGELAQVAISREAVPFRWFSPVRAQNHPVMTAQASVREGECLLYTVSVERFHAQTQFEQARTVRWLQLSFVQQIRNSKFPTQAECRFEQVPALQVDQNPMCRKQGHAFRLMPLWSAPYRNYADECWLADVINVSSVAGHKIGPGSAVYAATKHAVRALSEGLRQEVKPYNIRTTVISPGAVATELPNTISDAAAAEPVRGLYERVAIPADSFARAVVFAMSQPDDVDINEILFRPTSQEYWSVWLILALVRGSKAGGAAGCAH
jgi:NAD(P)-dependent dehydrogenase (short-subunit alcohol dehydrogenase family)